MDYDEIVNVAADGGYDAVVRYRGADGDWSCECARQLTIWAVLTDLQRSKNALAEIEIGCDGGGEGAV